jgi:hypothetical protein
MNNCHALQECAVDLAMELVTYFRHTTTKKEKAK